jgi:hypothetical protein
MLDFPQIVVPALLYNLVLCSLSAALAWHFVSLVSGLIKARTPNK